MWLEKQHVRKWRSDSLEARVYAAAEAAALAGGGSGAEAGAAGMDAVYNVMRWLQACRGEDVVARVMEGYGVKTSEAALSLFWRRFASPYLSEAQRRNAALATELADASDPGREARVEEGFWRQVREMAFGLMTAPDADAADLVRLGKLLISRRGTALDERKVKLLEQKAAFADEVRKKAGATPDGGLSREDMEEIERRLKFK